MRRVLLAIDGSVHSQEAVQFLAGLPHFDPIELTLMTVVRRPLVHPRYASPGPIEQVHKQELVAAKQLLEDSAKVFTGADIKVSYAISEGNARDAILEKAKKINADLIVLGATGHSDISRMLLGSTSDFVAAHAQRSVLIVRPRNDQRKGTQLKLCLAYNESSQAEAALEELMESPWRGPNEIHIVTVADCSGEAYSKKDCIQHYEAALGKAKNRLEEVADHVVTHLIENSHHGEGVTRFVEANDIDLVMVGETPRSHFTQFLLGSTSQYVTRHVPCSVWITRNRMIEGIKERHDKPTEAPV